MTTKWEINRAVRASSLPAPSRLIMLTLSDIAEAGTAEIPERRTPSLTVLARETGLGRSTVAEHLASLESGGWLKRVRPDVAAARIRGDRTCYRMTLPKGTKVVQEPDYLVQEPDGGSPGAGLGVVQEPDQPSPGAGHIKNDLDYQYNQDDPSPPKAAKASAKKRLPKVQPTRLDVERVCKHLAERIEAEGVFKRPTINQEWRDEARRLIDLDKRTEQQIITCIDWATRNRFWRKNIRSMATLREKYGRLQADAEDERAKNGTRANPYATPASNAPDRIAPSQQCPEHRDQRAGKCRHCAARAKAGYVG